MRACQPIADGYVERDGVKVFYELFGQREPTILLMPTWCIVHSRIWKMQIPYLARRHRVVTFDGPGNGQADRPTGPAAYTAAKHVDLTLGVLDATGTERAIAVAASGGTNRTVLLAAEHPDRVEGVVFVGPFTPLVTDPPNERTEAFASGDYELFLQRFMTAAFTEPHSTKAIEDGIGWGHETSLATIADARLGNQVDADTFKDLCARISCPVLVVQGTDDRVTPPHHGLALAEAIGQNSSVVLIGGGGHRTDVRDPVTFSRLLCQFIQTVHPTRPPLRRWSRASHCARRALYLSSPIGLGHARRDLAIARQLRALRPELRIDWLAQDPVTRLLDAEGERVHPASRHLASESAHIESESAEHDLHCFQAWRRMDEILLTNYMVVDDLLDQEHYDLVIGDEAWEVDHYLHENPERKRTAYAWLTDFVGWLPMPDGGRHEVDLTADYNAEMLEHIARFPRLRDRAIFVGNPDDIVPDTFGPDLPFIRDWTQAHYDFSGYVTGFDPAALGDRQELRERLGYHPDQQVCVVTVGGTGVGASLLRKIVEAFPLAKRALPELRIIVVAGPRIDPASLSAGYQEGLELRSFVPDLYRHLAACDLAVIQGGLTTAMELTANRRPFLYFPLAHHFEQTFHVPHRLDRYRAGRRMNYTTTDADAIVTAITAEIGREVDYRPVERDGASRAATLLAELL
jgi:pimeloyl-ACP methyl ester carboxylesterase/predicted glycosyltransferase